MTMASTCAAMGCALLATMATAPAASGTELGDPLPGLTDEELADFFEGQEEFEEEETTESGIGPVFNDISCAACHGPIIGGSNGRIEFRFGRTVLGSFDPLASLGGSLIQDHGIGSVADFFPDDPVCQAASFAAETIPAAANTRAGRRTTPLFGLGLVDAVPDQSFVNAALYQAVFTPQTAGVLNRVTNPDTGTTVVGKFGWKAQVPTMHAFAGDAYLNEMGITNPAFPSEICPQGNCAALACNPAPDLNDDGEDVDAFATFMTFLAPPPPPPANAITAAGQILFNTTGCGNCHTQTMTTGPNQVAALNQVQFAPYSDFLLHDMGSLGDGIVQGRATARLMRTAPLWGLHASIPTGLLHDGRAHTVQEAILAHEGQGALSRGKFQALSATNKAILVAFLSSL